MKMAGTWLAVVAMAVAATLAGHWIGKRAASTSIETPENTSGQAAIRLLTAPFKGMDGKPRSLAEWRGRILVVNFWATWCPPCRAEMPTIEAMYQEYKDQGFIVLAVDMTYQDDPFEVVPFTQEHNLTFPILLEETGDVAAAYQLRSLPSSYFINREGIISEVVIGGPMSEALLRTRIEQILK